MTQSSHIIGLLIERRADRRLLTEFFEEAGHTVWKEPPPKGALREWKESSLIITDVRAARRYGEEIVNLKWQVATSFLPLIIALPERMDGAPWLEAGFDDVLRLPIREAELKARSSVFLRLREQSERRYEAFFENALIGLYRITPDGRFLMANPALVQMLGYDSFEELMQAGASREVGPLAHRSTFERMAAGGQVANLESSWDRKDGSSIAVLENARAVYDEAGEVAYWEGAVEDITERKQAEEALKEAKEAAEASNRAKSTFLANVSHEIRTPLTSIVGFTSFLAKQVSDEQVEFIKLIEQSGKRLMDTLDAVLRLAKLEADHIEVEFEHLVVAEEVNQVVQLFQKEAEKKGLDMTIEVKPEAQAAKARLDSGALGSILQNLISNAIKFTEEGEVNVAVYTEPDSANGQPAEPHVHVSVEDSGNGIAPEFLPHLFDSFRQESTGANRSHEGSGLGLSIAKQLTELMDGTIDVESVMGEGSTFTVSFPLVDGHSEATDLPEGGASSFEGKAAILAVEDNEETRILLRSLFQDVADLTLVETAGEAVEAARRTTYDLVFLDINLKEEQTGIDVLNKLRTMKDYVNVPIVALTAFALPGNREDFLQAGFSHYLSKPFTADELLDLTSEILS